MLSVNHAGLRREKLGIISLFLPHKESFLLPNNLIFLVIYRYPLSDYNSPFLSSQSPTQYSSHGPFPSHLFISSTCTRPFGARWLNSSLAHCSPRGALQSPQQELRAENTSHKNLWPRRCCVTFSYIFRSSFLSGAASHEPYLPVHAFSGSTAPSVLLPSSGYLSSSCSLLALPSVPLMTLCLSSSLLL